MIQTVCVFCGSSSGAGVTYSEMAVELGRFFLKNQIRLVYGGANVGLMGTIADVMLEGEGEVIGVMPRALVEREVAHDGLTEMHIVADMQERKALMAQLSDGFITLPGAYGTLDELFELLTWNQLGIVNKPIGLLNVNGFFNPLITMVDRAVEDMFLRPEHRAILQIDETPEGLFEKLQNYKPLIAQKWIEGLKAGKI
jgi:uncharacterized protein (TIGR00730 family)